MMERASKSFDEREVYLQNQRAYHLTRFAFLGALALLIILVFNDLRAVPMITYYAETSQPGALELIDRINRMFNNLIVIDTLHQAIFYSSLLLIALSTIYMRIKFTQFFAFVLFPYLTMGVGINMLYRAVLATDLRPLYEYFLASDLVIPVLAVIIGGIWFWFSYRYLHYELPSWLSKLVKR